jgi:hypothetical protein
MVDFLPQLRKDPLATLRIIKETNPVLKGEARWEFEAAQVCDCCALRV